MRGDDDLISSSIWTETSEFDYMSKEQRADHPSHAVVIDLIKDHYGEAAFDLLDCGVLSGVSYQKLIEARLKARYTGIDISEKILDHCREMHPDAQWLQMSALDIAFESDSFDVVNCRHLLESLPYYETSVRELFRVARQHVAICLWLVPREPEKLLRRETDGGYIWLNRYGPGNFEALLDSLSESFDVIESTDGRHTNRIYFCTKRHP
ncbi:class I SAM-dependent methyltransferase [Rhodococcus erythropolis]|nr:class I SAM-dependent methyltransferase [Rhodococcus erythropolis]